MSADATYRVRKLSSDEPNILSAGNVLRTTLGGSETQVHADPVVDAHETKMTLDQILHGLRVRDLKSTDLIFADERWQTLSEFPPTSDEGSKSQRSENRRRFWAYFALVVAVAVIWRLLKLMRALFDGMGAGD